jgi:hypothetical protein
VFVAGVMTLFATIGAACTQSTFQLFGCRIVTGLALGIKASVGESGSHLKAPLRSPEENTDAIIPF